MLKLFSILFIVAFCVSGFAKDKKVVDRKPSSLMETNINKIKSKKSCDEASSLALKLASADTKGVQYASAASEVCYSEFQDKITEEDKKLLNDLNTKCSKKYSEMGTMYQSFAAFCKLRVAGVFSSLYFQE